MKVCLDVKSTNCCFQTSCTAPTSRTCRSRRWPTCWSRERRTRAGWWSTRRSSPPTTSCAMATRYQSINEWCLPGSSLQFCVSEVHAISRLKQQQLPAEWLSGQDRSSRFVDEDEIWKDLYVQYESFGLHSAFQCQNHLWYESLYLNFFCKIYINHSLGYEPVQLLR